MNIQCTSTSYVLSYLLNCDEFDINKYYKAINRHIKYANGSDIILHYIEQEFHPALCFGLCQKLSELDNGFKKMKNNFEALYNKHLNVLYEKNTISAGYINSKLDSGDPSIVQCLRAYILKFVNKYRRMINALESNPQLFHHNYEAIDFLNSFLSEDHKIKPVILKNIPDKKTGADIRQYRKCYKLNSETEQDFYCPTIKAFGLDLPIDDYYSLIKDQAKQYYSELRFFTYKMDPEIKAQLLSAKMSYVLLDKIILCRYFLYEIKCEIDKVTNPAFKKALEHFMIDLINFVDENIVYTKYKKETFVSILKEKFSAFETDNMKTIVKIHSEKAVPKPLPTRPFASFPVNEIEETYQPNRNLYLKIKEKYDNMCTSICTLYDMTNTKIHELIKQYVSKFTHFTSDYPSSKPYYCSENTTPELELYFGEQEKYLLDRKSVV